MKWIIFANEVVKAISTQVSDLDFEFEFIA